jgi:hypothetical protein
MTERVVTLDAARTRVGDTVLYQRPGVSERGVVTSVGQRYVFVRYAGDTGSKATRPEDLEWLPRTSHLLRIECLGPGEAQSLWSALDDVEVDVESVDSSMVNVPFTGSPSFVFDLLEMALERGLVSDAGAAAVIASGPGGWVR